MPAQELEAVLEVNKQDRIGQQPVLHGVPLDGPLPASELPYPIGELLPPGRSTLSGGPPLVAKIRALSTDRHARIFTARRNIGRLSPVATIRLSAPRYPPAGPTEPSKPSVRFPDRTFSLNRPTTQITLNVRVYTKVLLLNPRATAGQDTGGHLPSSGWLAALRGILSAADTGNGNTCPAAASH